MGHFVTPEIRGYSMGMVASKLERAVLAPRLRPEPVTQLILAVEEKSVAASESGQCIQQGTTSNVSEGLGRTTAVQDLVRLV